MTSSATIVGNLTRDPELRFTVSGRAVCNFGVAVSRRFQVNGEWTEEVSFFNVTCFGDLAENVAASFSKGDRLVCFGRFTQRSWQTDATAEKPDGERRVVVEFTAEEVGGSVRWATCRVVRTLRDHPGAVPAAGSVDPAAATLHGDDEPV